MRRLGVLAKYWAPGSVKTRLARSLGEEKAAELARLFLHCLLQRLGRASCHQRVLCHWPRDRSTSFAQLAGPDWQLTLQSEGDLGARMRDFLDQAWAAGASHVVLLGADSPSLPLERIEQAFAALDQSPVVLGPTHDGGYYLIGARRETPPLFADVDWGTSRVWRQTIAQAKARNLTVAELAPWFDVDHWNDLQRLRRELREPREVELAELAEAVEQVLE